MSRFNAIPRIPIFVTLHTSELRFWSMRWNSSDWFHMLLYYRLQPFHLLVGVCVCMCSRVGVWIDYRHISLLTLFLSLLNYYLQCTVWFLFCFKFRSGRDRAFLSISLDFYANHLDPNDTFVIYRWILAFKRYTMSKYKFYVFLKLGTGAALRSNSDTAAN